MIPYQQRDDKIRELVCRLIMFFVIYAMATFFSDGFTFVEGMIIWLFTGSHYDSTVILNHSRFRLKQGSMP